VLFQTNPVPTATSLHGVFSCEDRYEAQLLQCLHDCIVRQELDSMSVTFLTRRKRLHFCHVDFPSITQLFGEADATYSFGLLHALQTRLSERHNILYIGTGLGRVPDLQSRRRTRGYCVSTPTTRTFLKTSHIL